MSKFSMLTDQEVMTLKYMALESVERITESSSYSDALKETHRLLLNELIIEVQDRNKENGWKKF